MKKEEIDSWLRDNSERIGIDYRGIHSTESGESNHNFVVEADRKMVLRVSRDISRTSRLENEAEKLSFLEAQDIDAVPRKIHFEKDSDIGNVLLETFVGDEDVDGNNLNEERIRSLASRIAEIHSLTAETFEKFSGTQNKRDRDLKNIFREDFRKWSRRPYEEYMEMAEDPNERIEYYFEKQRQLVDNIPKNPVEQGLTHGDLGFNLRASGDSIFIIDWEFSRIDFPDNELLYCFEHEDLDERQREIFLDEYRKHRQLNSKFDEIRRIYPRFLAFNDMIWAAKRVEKGEDKEDLLKERMDKLEDYYR